MKKQSIVSAVIIASLMAGCLVSSIYAMGKKPQQPQQEVQQQTETQAKVDVNEPLPVIDVNVAHRLLTGNKAIFVDALTSKSYRVSRIPGAINIPAEAPEMNLKHLASAKKDDIIVVYCAHAKCGAAKKVAEFLVSQGFSQVYYFKGGKKDWQEAGYRLDH